MQKTFRVRNGAIMVRRCQKCARWGSGRRKSGSGEGRNPRALGFDVKTTDEATRVGRRSVLGGALASLVVAGGMAAVEIAAVERVHKHAQQLALALEDLHGGKWSIYYGETGFVSISRDFS